MRLIDKNGNDISETSCDLNKGYITETIYAPPEAYESIDNVTKFALDESDYEPVRMYIEYDEMYYTMMEKETKREERENLLNSMPETLASTDDAICELYETNLAHDEIISAQDDAICALYEMTLEVNNG